MNPSSDIVMAAVTLVIAQPLATAGCLATAIDGRTRSAPGQRLWSDFVGLAGQGHTLATGHNVRQALGGDVD